MIISHAHRYVFVQVPHTASTAIAFELRARYGGERILGKHATHAEFLRQATPDERAYFVFASVRHPLDAVVTHFSKLKHDHQGHFSGTHKPAPRRRKPPRPLTDEMRERYAFVQNTDDFPAFFRRYYDHLYVNWYLLNAEKFGMVMRYERIVDDFAEALRRIGITPQRPLPVVNKSERPREWQDFYDADARARAVRNFGPYMEAWNYPFPDDWGPCRVPALRRWHFRTLTGGARLAARLGVLDPRSAALDRLRRLAEVRR